MKDSSTNNFAGSGFARSAHHFKKWAKTHLWALPGAFAVGLLSLSGCASMGSSPGIDSPRLAEVRAVSDPSVSYFRYIGVNSFEPLGDRDVLIYTNPRQAYLLHLAGPCVNLDFGPSISLTSFQGRVTAGIDKVLTRDGLGPCRIHDIRPVDAKRLRDHDGKGEAPVIHSP
ncbi:MAG: DUF6491 family protein [Lysobacteraceae bacterium]